MPPLIVLTFDLDRVEAEHEDAGLGEGHREGESDVAETDDADLGCAGLAAAAGAAAGRRDGLVTTHYCYGSATPTERTAR